MSCRGRTRSSLVAPSWPRVPARGVFGFSHIWDRSMNLSVSKMFHRECKHTFKIFFRFTPFFLRECMFFLKEIKACNAHPLGQRCPPSTVPHRIFFPPRSPPGVPMSGVPSPSHRTATVADVMQLLGEKEGELVLLSPTQSIESAMEILNESLPPPSIVPSPLQ